MTEPGRRPLTAREILRIPEYRLLWLGQIVSEAGDALTNIALLLLVNALTGSTAALAAMAIVLAIPPLTIGLFAGGFADRHDRRRIMLASDLLRAVFVLAFVLVGTADALWLLYLVAFVQASIGSFFQPARGALVPKVVPVHGLLAANSIVQASRVISTVIGAGLGGAIVGLAGTFWPAFVIDAGSFVVSFLLILRLPAALGRIEAQPAGAPASGALGGLTDGLRVVARSRVLLTTISILSVAMLGFGAVNVLFVPLLVNILAVNPAWIGGIDLVMSASMILATGLIGVLARRFATTTIVMAGVLGVALSVGLVGLATDIWHVLALMFLTGWFLSPFQAAVMTIVQTATVDAQRGRVLAVIQASSSATSVISMAFAGIAGEVVGVRNVFLGAGLIAAVGALVAFVGYRGRAAERIVDRPALPVSPAEALPPAAIAD